MSSTRVRRVALFGGHAVDSTSINAEVERRADISAAIVAKSRIGDHSNVWMRVR